MNKHVGELIAVDTCPVELYGAEYYASHCGPFPYERSAHWLQFFAKTADELIRAIRPTCVFDAGCAHGFLVEAFWDRGVEAYGRDISSFTISRVRPDLRPYCEVGSISDPLPDHYDLVTCIEVLEHMPEKLALRAIRSMTAATTRIFFSSSPDDFDEPTHVNVRPPIYWLRRFAEAGFAPVPGFDGSFLCHQAMLLEHRDGPIDEQLLLGQAEIIRLRLEILQRHRSQLEFQHELNRNPFFIPVRVANRVAKIFRNCADRQTGWSSAKRQLGRLVPALGRRELIIDRH